MSRRRTKAQDRALGYLIAVALVIGLPVYGIGKAGEALGWPLLIGGIIALFAAVLLVRFARIKERRAALLRKYGDPQVVENIMRGAVWQGQSADMLRDSRGPPLDMDEHVSKTITRHVWKYKRTGVNRFALRITLDNGVVTGWDDKT
jgi:hypothetical protein